jgi:hypothetical protein
MREIIERTFCLSELGGVSDAVAVWPEAVEEEMLARVFFRAICCPLFREPENQHLLWSIAQVVATGRSGRH